MAGKVFDRPLLIGHRGAAAVAPENTAASLRAGVEAGADLIEFDVRLSADHRAVLLHDARIDRTTDGSGDIGRWKWETLSTLDAGSWFSSKFRNERLIDLDQALRILRPGTGVIVELKSESDENRSLLDVVLKAIEHSGGNGGVTISCNRWPLLEAVSAMAAGIDLALTVGMTELRDPLSAAGSIGAGALHVNRNRLTRDFISRAHDRGLAIYAYTVNDRKLLEKVVSLGVDGVFSDDPARLRQLI